MSVPKSILPRTGLGAALAVALIASIPTASAAFAQPADAGERHGPLRLFHHGTARAGDAARQPEVAEAPAAKPARPALAHHRGVVAAPAPSAPPVTYLVVGYDPTRYGINRYARPAYVGAGRLPAVTRIAPWEPYVDGGSVVGRPVYTLAPALVAAPLAAVYRPVWRHYHRGWHAARY